MKTKILRGKHGTAVKLTLRDGHFFIRVRGAAQQPVTYIDEGTGSVLGTFSSGTFSKEMVLHANGSQDALVQAAVVLKSVERATPDDNNQRVVSTSIETPQWLENLKAQAGNQTLSLPSSTPPDLSDTIERLFRE
jgi:hypothetical protein